MGDPRWKILLFPPLEKGEEGGFFEIIRMREELRMDFFLTEEQKMIQQMARDFAEKELKPRAAEIDATRQLPLSILKSMAGLGMMGMNIPAEYGGSLFHQKSADSPCAGIFVGLGPNNKNSGEVPTGDEGLGTVEEVFVPRPFRRGLHGGWV